MYVNHFHSLRLILLMFCAIGLAGCVAIDVELEFAESPNIYSQIIHQTSDRYSDVEPLQLSPEILSMLDAYIGPRDNGEERLDKLQDILYGEEFLNIQYADDTTHTAVEVFAAKQGNCLSVMNLYVAMARYVGLDANFQTVAVQPAWDIRGGLLVLSQHINATGRFNVRRRYVVDFTPEIGLQKLTASIIDDQEARALYFNNLGVEALIKHDFNQALIYFKNALFLDIELSIAWNNIGATYNRLGNREFSEYSYQVAFQKDNTNATAINNLTKFYYDSGKVELARKYEQATKQFNNRNPYFQFARGNLAYNRNNLNAARISYRKAIRLDSLEPDFYSALAQVYSELGDVARAKRTAESAKKIIAQNADIYQPSSQKVRIIDSGTILRSSSPGLSIILDGSRGVGSRC